MRRKKHATVISSVTCGEELLPAGVAYVCSALRRAGWEFDFLDLRGSLDAAMPPDELLTPFDSPLWMSPQCVEQGEWMDPLLPPLDEVGPLVLFSAAFAPDLLFHARLSHSLRRQSRGVITAIGGTAVLPLTEEQLALLGQF
ncbi:hypothetical protein ACFL6C_11035 [Myxococcota bacterium]